MQTIPSLIVFKPLFLAWTQIIWENSQKRLFLVLQRNTSINRKNRLCDPYKAFWDHSESRKIGVKKLLKPSHRKNRQKNFKKAKITILRLWMLLNVSITVPNKIIYSWKDKFCDFNAILGWFFLLLRFEGKLGQKMSQNHFKLVKKANSHPIEALFD